MTSTFPLDSVLPPNAKMKIQDVRVERRHPMNIPEADDILVLAILGIQSFSTISLHQTSAELEYPHDIDRKIEAALDAELRDEDEPAPTEYAIHTAKELISRTAPLLKGFRFPATVSAFNGTIRIVWSASSRNVRFVCNPSPMNESYIFHERLIKSRSVEHGSEKATYLALTKWLQWLNRAI